MKISIDTDCIISLFSPSDVIHSAMLLINQLFKEGKINLYVSLKTINQLSEKGGNVLEYAKSLLKLPNYMVGTIGKRGQLPFLERIKEADTFLFGVQEKIIEKRGQSHFS